MPSPDETPAAPATSTDQSSVPASTDTIKPNGDASGTPQPANGITADRLAAEKDKAKALMASGASTAGVEKASTPNPSSRPASAAPAPPPSDSNRTPTPSRKRSRSGSRIDNSSSHQNGDPAAIPTTKELTLNEYISRDQVHSAAYLRDRERSRDLLQSMEQEFADFQKWRSSIVAQKPRGQTHLIYPQQRRRPGGRRTRELRLSRKEREEQAQEYEDLVPIRLDLELDKLRLRDTFTWNYHDNVVPMADFAQGLVEDFRIPPESYNAFINQVMEAMREQISDYHPHPFIEEEPLDPHLPYTAYKNDELRILIKLNITVGNHTLVDQFDWDINNPWNSPEEFARQMARDLSLSGEFMTAIAHSIREQAETFTKSLYISAHPFDGRPVDDSDVRDSLLPSPMPSVFRPYQSAKEFAPAFYELSEADLERTETVFSREQRQQKRSVNRRGGPSLPDLKDRLKTWRTQIVSSVIPGAADTVESSGVYKIPRTSGRRKPWNAGRGEDSEGSEDDESDEETTLQQVHALQGTSRTRGMRGAAAAAQSAMRANLARSTTPESMLIDHHGGRAASRRYGGYEVTENADGTMSLLLRLKMPRERFRQWWRDWKKVHGDPREEKRRQAAALRASQTATPQHGSPAAMHRQHQALPSSLLARGPTMQQGGPSPPGGGGGGGTSAAPAPGPEPPAPAWLQEAVASLMRNNPGESVLAMMRWDTNAREWSPRIRCLDCPGMLYRADPQEPLENFNKHLRLEKHAQARDARLGVGGQ